VSDLPARTAPHAAGRPRRRASLRPLRALVRTLVGARALPVVTLVCLAAASFALAQPSADAPAGKVLDYHDGTDWILETPGVTSGALGGFINPAAWSALQPGRQEIAGWFRSANENLGNNWGLATSGWLGAAVQSEFWNLGGEKRRVTSWQLGLSGGNRGSRVGLAYRWATGDTDVLGREDALVAGWLWRPGRLLSLGASGTWSMASSARQGVFDLGLRPWNGNHRLTLFADHTLNEKDRLGQDDGRWGLGVTAIPFAGVHVGVTAREVTGAKNWRWVFQVGVNLADGGTHAVASTDASAKALDYAHLVVRYNPPLPNATDEPEWPFAPSAEQFAYVSLENRYLTYQRYRYFDDTRVSWLHLSGYLDAIARDDRLEGLALNLVDFRARPSLVWELREQLQAIKDAGKEVAIMVGRVDILGYYLASVADHVIMDPEGDLVLQGIASGRTYYRDLLERMGLGFQELRYFRYKSAAETGSRMEMSEGEREQDQRMVDVIYGELRDAICAARGLSDVEFDRFVNETVGLTAPAAKAAGLVDDLGRGRDLEGHFRKQWDRPMGPHPGLAPDAWPEAQWGHRPQIAVVYAVGPCAMDSGIRGRATSYYLRGLLRDDRVKAVVLRADSPGGDPLPSDLVAGAIADLNAAGKPVIVSQGDVAASGGYWISMRGAEILTTPLTITGSIGVIAAWIHDAGAGEKLGLAYDGVQVGEHADLLRQLRLPWLGIGVPQRGLSEDELELAREYILAAYDDFVGGVAEARDLPEEHVREVAQGRVWMGGDAIERKLCDRFGGLQAAIALARERAGLPAGRQVALVEYPPQPLIDWSALLGDRGGFGLPFGLAGVGERIAGRLLGLAQRTGVPWVPADADLGTRVAGQADADATRQGGSAVARLAGPGLAPDLIDGDPTAFDYGLWYVETLGSRMGQPQAVLPPSSLPAGWGLPD